MKGLKKIENIHKRMTILFHSWFYEKFHFEYVLTKRLFYFESSTKQNQ
ncbi:hypothetical protein BSM4216_1796 [Bacillus smithii]|nr:hypothetical protein BSM4216_1796 [Bacillus smithii]